MSIGGMSLLVPDSHDNLFQGGWQASSGRASSLDANRVAATHPGLYAQVNARSTRLWQEVHHHYLPPAKTSGMIDRVVQHAQLREAQIKTEVERELGQRDVREAQMVGEGNALLHRLAAIEAENIHLRQQSQRLEEVVMQLLQPTSGNDDTRNGVDPPTWTHQTPVGNGRHSGPPNDGGGGGSSPPRIWVMILPIMGAVPKAGTQAFSWVSGP